MGFTFNLSLCGGKGERTWLGDQFAPAKWSVYSEEGPEQTITLKGGIASSKKLLVRIT